MKKHAVATALALISAALSASASLVLTTDSFSNGTDTVPHAFTPSSTDLINGLAATSVTGNFAQEGTGGTPVLTDGLFPSPITRDAGGAFQFSAFATGGNTGGTSLTYVLGSAKNIGSITIYGGWQDSGRDQQSYNILYSTASAPGTFLPLTTVNFQGDVTTHPQLNRVTVSDTTGTLAGNVAALRFDFNATENGYAGYAEIDVFAAVPEPGSLAMLGLAALGAVTRRRR
ncbi:MAG: PEP-CTERM sorting domain-containing protein [Verrucomicrobiota bacterium]